MIRLYISFLDVFSTKNGYQKTHLGLSPNIFLSVSLSHFKGRNSQKTPFTRPVGYVGLLMTAFKVLNQSDLRQNLFFAPEVADYEVYLPTHGKRGLCLFQIPSWILVLFHVSLPVKVFAVFDELAKKSKKVVGRFIKDSQLATSTHNTINSEVNHNFLQWKCVLLCCLVLNIFNDNHGTIFLNIFHFI